MLTSSDSSAMDVTTTPPSEDGTHFAASNSVQESSQTVRPSAEGPGPHAASSPPCSADALIVGSLKSFSGQVSFPAVLQGQGSGHPLPSPSVSFQPDSGQPLPFGNGHGQVSSPA